MTKLKYTPEEQFENEIRLFHDYEDDEDVLCSQRWLLTDTWDFWHELDEDVFVFLAFRSVESGKWHEHAIEMHRDHLEIGSLLTRYSRWDYDQYFCANPFFKPRRKRKHALPTRFGWCDMDESDPEEYDPWASLVWETSPGRYQALWAWDRTHPVADAEMLSKALAYRHGGDKNGWSATKMLRVPGSVNHKLQYDEPFVRLLRLDWTGINQRPMPLADTRQKWPANMAEVDADPNTHDRLTVLKTYWKALHPKVRTLIRNRKAYEPNRSAQIFHMVAGLHEAGASLDEIASVLWDSPYFVDKHGHEIGKLNDEIGRVIGKLGDGK